VFQGETYRADRRGLKKSLRRERAAASRRSPTDAVFTALHHSAAHFIADSVE